MAGPSVGQEERQLVRRAVRRLGIALVLIATAIAGLALLDRYNATQKGVEAPRPEPRALPQPPVRPPSEPSAAGPAPPSSTAPAQVQPPPPPPVVTNETLAPSEGAAPKAAEEHAGIQPTPPTPALPQGKPAPAAAPAPKPSLEKGPSKAVEPSPPKGYLVQVGVFTTPENARVLQAKLARKGIPAFIETRVVVGPFKDHAEADAANKRLKEMGLQGVVVAPR
ncbi:MAG TPA: SPOR domain-containing protein [Burkholderiales bacterium]|nr:SPOR domain-containing protein [Burkholderiales bacterium]